MKDSRTMEELSKDLNKAFRELFDSILEWITHRKDC